MLVGISVLGPSPGFVSANLFWNFEWPTVFTSPRVLRVEARTEVRIIAGLFFGSLWSGTITPKNRGYDGGPLHPPPKKRRQDLKIGGWSHLVVH